MNFAMNFAENNTVLDVGFGEVTDFNADMYQTGYDAGFVKGADTKQAEMEADNAVILGECNTALVDKGAEPADSLANVPERIGEIEVVIDLAPAATLYRCENLNLFGAKEVVFNLYNAKGFSSFYRVTSAAEHVPNTTVEHITVNCNRQPTHCGQMFYINDVKGDKTLKRITLNIDTSKAAMSNFSAYLVALEVVDGTPLDLSSAGNVNRIFSACPKLREVRFVAGSIKGNIHLGSSAVFSPETIQSVIDGLADLTGSDTKTLTLHTTAVVNLTDEQWVEISAKNWDVV